MNLGLIGLPQVGKKTLFRILTGVPAERAPSRHGIRYGIAPVHDPRIDVLRDMYQPRRTRYAEFEIALPPDLQPGSSRDSEWLEPLRGVDALVHVVRAFTASHVFHVEGDVRPARDLETVDMELLLSDLALVETRLSRLAKEMRSGDVVRAREQAMLKRSQAHLETERPLRLLQLSDDELEILAPLRLLTLKPLVVVINGDEETDAPPAGTTETMEVLAEQGIETVLLSASIEAELAELEADERAEFMAELDIREPAAHRLSRAAYQALGLISFFTVGEDEVRAWPVVRNSTAPEAAGRIHSDLQRGFIRAETIHYDALLEAGNERAARGASLYRLNGKDYVVSDGDILCIRFSV